MPTRTVPIVGAHFRPPAKAILQCLPQGTPLRVEREPENEYDQNAIKVLVATTAIPIDQHSELEALSAGYGVSLEDILSQEEWHLGYVDSKKTGAAAILSPQLASATNIEARLSFDGEGKPQVKISCETSNV